MFTALTIDLKRMRAGLMTLHLNLVIDSVFRLIQRQICRLK